MHRNGYTSWIKGTRSKILSSSWSMGTNGPNFYDAYFWATLWKYSIDYGIKCTLETRLTSPNCWHDPSIHPVSSCSHWNLNSAKDNFTSMHTYHKLEFNSNRHTLKTTISFYMERYLYLIYMYIFNVNIHVDCLR